MKYPLLFVAKIAPQRVSIDDWFKVSIIVSNLGNDSAYNLTVIDESYPTWALETDEYYGNYFIDELKPNVSLVIEYHLRILSSEQEEFSLGRARVRYYDSKGKMFTAVSEECIVHLKKFDKSAEVLRASRILLICALLIVVPAALFLMVNDYKIYREYVRASGYK